METLMNTTQRMYGEAKTRQPKAVVHKSSHGVDLSKPDNWVARNNRKPITTTRNKWLKHED